MCDVLAVDIHGLGFESEPVVVSRESDDILFFVRGCDLESFCPFCFSDFYSCAVEREADGLIGWYQCLRCGSGWTKNIL